MSNTTVRHSVTIRSTKEKVWDVLVRDEYTRQWYAFFGPAAHAETNWRPGSKILFVDNSGSGVAGTIAVSKPAEELTIEYLGIVTNGVEDYTSADALRVKGGKERYLISGGNGSVTLAVEGDIPEEMYSMMSSAWEKALAKIVELAEN